MMIRKAASIIKTPFRVDKDDKVNNEVDVPGEEAGEQVPEGAEDLVVEDDVDPGVRHCTTCRSY